jgi:hypothetical protein
MKDEKVPPIPFGEDMSIPSALRQSLEKNNTYDGTSSKLEQIKNNPADFVVRRKSVLEIPLVRQLKGGLPEFTQLLRTEFAEVSTLGLRTPKYWIFDFSDDTKGTYTQIAPGELMIIVESVTPVDPNSLRSKDTFEFQSGWIESLRAVVKYYALHVHKHTSMLTDITKAAQYVWGTTKTDPVPSLYMVDVDTHLYKNPEENEAINQLYVIKSSIQTFLGVCDNRVKPAAGMLLRKVEKLITAVKAGIPIDTKFVDQYI